MGQHQIVFFQKIINCFTPNTPLKVKEVIDSEDNFLVYVALYYGNEIPSWKIELLDLLQLKVSEYTQKNTILCRTKKDFEKLKIRYGLSKQIKSEDENIFG